MRSSVARPSARTARVEGGRGDRDGREHCAGNHGCHGQRREHPITQPETSPGTIRATAVSATTSQADQSGAADHRHADATMRPSTAATQLGGAHERAAVTTMTETLLLMATAH